MDFWLLFFFAIIKKETFPIISLQKLFIPCNRMQMQFIYIFFQWMQRKTHRFSLNVFLFTLSQKSITYRFRGAIKSKFFSTILLNLLSIEPFMPCKRCIYMYCMLRARQASHFQKKNCINTKLLDIHTYKYI